MVSILRTSRVLLAGALLLIGLAACAKQEHRLVTYAGWKQAEPFPEAEAAHLPVHHVVQFGPADQAMTDIEREALMLFLNRHNLKPGSQVAVSVAAASAAEAGQIANRLASVRAELARLGVGSRPQPAPATVPPGQIVVTATVLAVLPVPCPGYNEPIVLDFERRPILNPGCSNANNLGVMIANPADLAMGRALGPADGEASTLGIQRYRGGAVLPTGNSQQTVPFRLETN